MLKKGYVIFVIAILTLPFSEEDRNVIGSPRRSTEQEPLPFKLDRLQRKIQLLESFLEKLRTTTSELETSQKNQPVEVAVSKRFEGSTDPTALDERERITVPTILADKSEGFNPTMIPSVGPVTQPAVRGIYKRGVFEKLGKIFGFGKASSTTAPDFQGNETSFNEGTDEKGPDSFDKKSLFERIRKFFGLNRDLKEKNGTVVNELDSGSNQTEDPTYTPMILSNFESNTEEDYMVDTEGGRRKRHEWAWHLTTEHMYLPELEEILINDTYDALRAFESALTNKSKDPELHKINHAMNISELRKQAEQLKVHDAKENSQDDKDAKGQNSYPGKEKCGFSKQAEQPNIHLVKEEAEQFYIENARGKFGGRLKEKSGKFEKFGLVGKNGNEYLNDKRKIELLKKKGKAVSNSRLQISGTAGNDDGLGSGSSQTEIFTYTRKILSNPEKIREEEDGKSMGDGWSWHLTTEHLYLPESEEYLINETYGAINVIEKMLTNETKEPELHKMNHAMNITGRVKQSEHPAREIFGLSDRTRQHTKDKFELEDTVEQDYRPPTMEAFKFVNEAEKHNRGLHSANDIGLRGVAEGTGRYHAKDSFEFGEPVEHQNLNPAREEFQFVYQPQQHNAGQHHPEKVYGSGGQGIKNPRKQTFRYLGRKNSVRRERKRHDWAWHLTTEHLYLPESEQNLINETYKALTILENMLTNKTKQPELHETNHTMKTFRPEKESEQHKIHLLNEAYEVAKEAEPSNIGQNFAKEALRFSEEAGQLSLHPANKVFELASKDNYIHPSEEGIVLAEPAEQHSLHFGKETFVSSEEAGRHEAVEVQKVAEGSYKHPGEGLLEFAEQSEQSKLPPAREITRFSEPAEQFKMHPAKDKFEPLQWERFVNNVEKSRGVDSSGVVDRNRPTYEYLNNRRVEKVKGEEKLEGVFRHAPSHGKKKLRSKPPKWEKSSYSLL